MKSKLPIIAAIALLLTLIAWQITTRKHEPADQRRQLSSAKLISMFEVGARRAEVERILGEPDTRDRSPYTERMYYRQDDGSTVCFTFVVDQLESTRLESPRESR